MDGKMWIWLLNWLGVLAGGGGAVCSRNENAIIIASVDCVYICIMVSFYLKISASVVTVHKNNKNFLKKKF